MTPSAHELVLDLEPPVTAENGLLYRVTVVARAAPDGHWNAYLEFVARDSQDVMRTDIETHQATQADLHHWATMLGDVYLRGALDRALASPAETAAHRLARREAMWPSQRSGRVVVIAMACLGMAVSLRLSSSGVFTYLSSEPGQYIRLTRLNDKISYIEHVDLGLGSVTWWGELRIAVGK